MKVLKDRASPRHRVSIFPLAGSMSEMARPVTCSASPQNTMRPSGSTCPAVTPSNPLALMSNTRCGSIAGRPICAVGGSVQSSTSSEKPACTTRTRENKRASFFTRFLIFGRKQSANFDTGKIHRFDKQSYPADSINSGQSHAGHMFLRETTDVRRQWRG